jgi:hypothetical protein
MGCQPTRLGHVSRTTLGILAAVGILVLLFLGAWLGGCLSRKGGREPPSAAHQPPAAELKIEVVTPLPKPILGGPSLGDSLAAVAGAVEAKAGLLDDPARFATGKPQASWGDQRKGAVVNPSRNWEIRFLKGNTTEKYARQLDFFEIEIAAVMPDNKLIYASKLSKAKPETRTGPADEEKRCYLTWSDGDLSRADADLLTRAGAGTGDRVVLKVLPPAIEATLAGLEKTYAGDAADDVYKTRFGIRAAGDGYEFYVLDQYRRERAKP